MDPRSRRDIRGGGRTLGIVGGMGPAATAFFYDYLVRITPARCDQEHIPVIIGGDPTIPDRTRAILSQGPSPVPKLVETIRTLARAGAEFAVLPCNSAHFYYDEIEAQSPIPLLNMIEETSDATARELPTASTIGILGTTATTRSDIYGRPLRERGIKAMAPAAAERDAVMGAIHAIKGGSVHAARSIVDKAASSLVGRGAEAVILACTELSLCYSSEPPTFPAIDSTKALAHAAVRTATRPAVRVLPEAIVRP